MVCSNTRHLARSKPLGLALPMDACAFLQRSPFGLRSSYVPFEIVVTILANLDWRTLVRCSAVCRFWHHAIRGTLALQYKIELGANGLINGDFCSLSIPERLRLLHDRRRAWRGLDFKRCANVPMPGECHAYELVGGVFAKAMNPQSDMTVGPAGLFVPNHGSRHFIISRLPTAAKDSETIVREDIGFLCKDFGIDPTQDLIVFVEQPDFEKPSITVHLRTISTNEKHPSATVPVLYQPMRCLYEGAEIQICEDVVSILVRIHGIPRLVIWQWTTGNLLVSELNPQNSRSMDDFSLLSSYAFMMTRRFQQASVRIYTFRTPSGQLLQSRPAKLVDLKFTSLLLPTLQPNNHYAELSTHTSPFTARVPSGKPFATSEDARVHVMNVMTQPTQPPHSSSDSELGHTTAGRAASFVVVLLNRALLRHADQQIVSDRSEDKANGKKNIEVPWDDWGPRNTRWFAERSTHAWQRYVHGSRIVRALHNAWPSTRCRMQVLDFCVFPSRLGAEDDKFMEAADDAEPDVKCAHRLVVGPSLVRDRAVFKGGGVESRLPYREATLKKELGPYSGFMIDEERVIGLSAMAFANGDMKQVDVFTF